MDRISFDNYFMALAHVVKLRSEDPSRQVGAVCSDDEHRIIATGYNGFTKGLDLGKDVALEDRKKYIIHAECNALPLCENKKINTIAVTTSPCSNCAKLIARYNVKRVLYGSTYDGDPEGLNILKFYKIESILIPFSNLQEYFNSLVSLEKK